LVPLRLVQKLAPVDEFDPVFLEQTEDNALDIFRTPMVRRLCILLLKRLDGNGLVHGGHVLYVEGYFSKAGAFKNFSNPCLRVAGKHLAQIGFYEYEWVDVPDFCVYAFDGFYKRLLYPG